MSHKTWIFIDSVIKNVSSDCRNSDLQNVRISTYYTTMSYHLKIKESWLLLIFQIVKCNFSAELQNCTHETQRHGRLRTFRIISFEELGISERKFWYFSLIYDHWTGTMFKVSTNKLMNQGCRDFPLSQSRLLNLEEVETPTTAPPPLTCLSFSQENYLSRP